MCSRHTRHSLVARLCKGAINLHLNEKEYSKDLRSRLASEVLDVLGDVLWRISTEVLRLQVRRRILPHLCLDSCMHFLLLWQLLAKTEKAHAQMATHWDSQAKLQIVDAIRSQQGKETNTWKKSKFFLWLAKPHSVTKEGTSLRPRRLSFVSRSHQSTSEIKQ